MPRTRIFPYVSEAVFGPKAADVEEKQDTILGYDVVTHLGAGALGDVKLGVCPRTGETVAIKIVDYAKAAARHIEQSDNEVCALEALRGAPHCLQLKAASSRTTLRSADGPREVYAQVTEFAEFGDLFELIDAGGAFSEPAAKALFRQLLRGLRALESNGVVAHRDIKPENLLVGGDGALRIADFNLSAHANVDVQTPERERRRRASLHRDSLLRSSCGSRSYMAPEVHGAASGEEYRGPPADVWSAAVVLFTLLVGHPPFDEASRRCWFFRKACAEGKPHLFWTAHAQSATAARDAADGGISDDAKALLMNAFTASPSMRATLDELWEHPWLARGDELSHAQLRDELARRAGLVPRINQMRELLAARKIGSESPRGVEEDDHYE